MSAETPVVETIDPTPTDATPAAARVRRLPLGRLGQPFGGIVAIGTKELRGRMRGRRAFAFLTFYVTVLTLFAWMVELTQERNSNAIGGAAFASASVGQTIFVALILLETLLVIFLAPAYTAGAISMEREKQTLDLLAVTPISSLAIVLGKLLSALTFVYLLILSSIPLTAIVFVFGGVAPDDVIRGYLVLLIAAFGIGSIGLFCSALVRRTQAATVLTYLIVLALALGSVFAWAFWSTMGRDRDTGVRAHPPAALLWLNPFVGQADVVCGMQSTVADTCGFVNDVIGGPNTGIPVPLPQTKPGVGGGIGPAPAIIDDSSGAIAPDDLKRKIALGQAGRIVGGVGAPAPVVVNDVAFAAPRDRLWPLGAAAWLGVSTVLILLSVQLVTPTRRWHPIDTLRARLGRGRA